MISLKEKDGNTLVIETSANIIEDFQEISQLLKDEYAIIGDAMGAIVVAEDAADIEPIMVYRAAFLMYATVSRWPVFPQVIVGKSAKFIPMLRPVFDLFGIKNIGHAEMVEEGKQWISHWFLQRKPSRETLYGYQSGSISSRLRDDVAMRHVSEHVILTLDEVDKNIASLREQQSEIASFPYCTGRLWQDKDNSYRVLHRKSEQPCPVHGSSKPRIRDRIALNEAQRVISTRHERERIERELAQLTGKRSGIINAVFSLFWESIS